MNTPPIHRPLHNTLSAAALLLTLLCASAQAHAQVNTEKFHLGKEEHEGWQAELASRLALTRGNVNVTDISGTISVRHQTLWPLEEWERALPTPPPRVLARRWSFVGSLRRARALERIFSNQAFAHARWTRMWTRRLGAELFTQLQFDEFIALRMRLLVGGYARYVPVRTTHFRLAIGTGYMPEYERFDTETVGPSYRNPRLNHRWSNYLMIAANVSPMLQCQLTSYVQPRFDRFHDVHMLHSLIASLEVMQHVALTLTAEVQADLEPPPTIEPVDVRITPGLSMKW